MSDRRNEEHRREYTEQEQTRSFIGRRMDAFANRTREPGDAATWAVVIGALMCTLLVICYSVAGQSLVALLSFLVAIIWIGVLGRFGKVNVFSILWGAATTDSKTPPNEFAVFQSTGGLAIISLIAVVVNAFTGWGFGWYGVALLTVIGIYLVIYIQASVLPAR